MEPAIKPAANIHPSEKILLCATPATISGKKLHDLIVTSGAHPDLVALPKLVTFAENFVFDTDTVCAYFDETIDKTQKYAAVVLGCTHFSYFRDSFRKYLGNIDIIDGTAGTVKRLISVLSDKINNADHNARGTVKYVRSGADAGEQDVAYFEKMSDRAEQILMLD